MGCEHIVNIYSNVDFKKRAFQLKNKSCNEKRKGLVLETKKELFDKEMMKYSKVKDVLHLIFFRFQRLELRESNYW